LVSLNFTFDPGNIYELSFDLAGLHKNNTNQIVVTLGDLFSQTYTLYTTIRS
jgi:hypothetical protein